MVFEHEGVPFLHTRQSFKILMVLATPQRSEVLYWGPGVWKECLYVTQKTPKEQSLAREHAF